MVECRKKKCAQNNFIYQILQTIIPYVYIKHVKHWCKSALTKSVCFIALFSTHCFESCKTNVQHYKYAIGENLKAIQNTTLVNDIFVCVLCNLYVVNIMHDVPIEIVCTKQIIKWCRRIVEEKWIESNEWIESERRHNKATNFWWYQHCDIK